jgi:hypothetical protein
MTIEALGPVGEPWAASDRWDAAAEGAGAERSTTRTGSTGGDEQAFDLITRLGSPPAASLPLHQLAGVAGIEREPRSFMDRLDLGNPYERIFGSLRTAALRRDATVVAADPGAAQAEVTRSAIAQAVVAQASVAHAAVAQTVGTPDPASDTPSIAVQAVTPAAASAGPMLDDTPGLAPVLSEDGSVEPQPAEPEADAESEAGPDA